MADKNKSIYDLNIDDIVDYDSREKYKYQPQKEPFRDIDEPWDQWQQRIHRYHKAEKDREQRHNAYISWLKTKAKQARTKKWAQYGGTIGGVAGVATTAVNPEIREMLARNIEGAVQYGYLKIPQVPRDVLIAGIASAILGAAVGARAGNRWNVWAKASENVKEKVYSYIKANYGKIFSALLMFALSAYGSSQLTKVLDFSNDNINMAVDYGAASLAGVTGAIVGSKAYSKFKDWWNKKPNYRDYPDYKKLSNPYSGIDPMSAHVPSNNKNYWSAFVPPSMKRLTKESYEDLLMLEVAQGIPPTLVHSAALAQKNGQTAMWLARNRKKYGAKAVLAMQLAKRKMIQKPSYNDSMLKRRRKVKVKHG